MDIKYLKEHNLLEAHKQFMRLCEWSYVPSLLPEDEEEENMGDQMPPMDMNQGEMGGDGQMPQGQVPPMDGQQDPNMMGGNQMPPMDGQQDPNMMGGEAPMPPMDGQQDPNMDMGMPQMGGEAPMQPAEEEEVIDVEQLTDAQETMNDKVNAVGQNLGDVDAKISQLLGALNQMQTMIDNNNKEIANFKQEFEKRNPTQTEKLNLRSLDSYPFNVNPQDYWREKGAEIGGNYSAYADNDKSTTQEYEITNNDVDNFDEREIEHSFDADLDELHQDIAKIFGL